LAEGAHSFSFGGGFTRVNQWNDSTQVVPSIGFGVQSGLDPADGLFNTTNFRARRRRTSRMRARSTRS
jgi:hypothetical protein